MACDMTAIILTKNEEMNLTRCLESIKKLVTRIVVVDSGSTDRTLEIARSFGADIYSHEWVHYANQFNWALENVNVKTKWVFRIDADEIVPADLAEEIERECIKHADDDVNGFDMPFKLFFLGRYLKHGGTYPVWKVTIFKYAYGKFEDRAMGEHVVLSSGKSIKLKNDCLHHDFKDLSSWILKHNDYSTREVMDHCQLANEIKRGGLEKLEGRAEAVKGVRDSFYYRCPSFIRARLYYWCRYYLMLGFLDGTPGRIYAFLQAYWYRYLVDAKLYEREVSDTTFKDSQ